MRARDLLGHVLGGLSWLWVQASVCAAGEVDPPGDAFPDLDLSVEAPRWIDAGPGERIEYSASVLLHATSAREESEGLRAWSLGLRTVKPLQVIDATTDGTDGAPRPVGLREDGWEKTELAMGQGNVGAVSVVVLSLSSGTALPIPGTYRLLELRLAMDAPDRGIANLLVTFQDGLVGSGQPVKNVITYGNGFTRRDDGGEMDNDADGYEGGATICRVRQPFVRGNVNGDAAINLSDAASLLGHLFQGRVEPACLEAADINGDGRVNISDAVFLLNHLFGGGAAPEDPYPLCGWPEEGLRLSCDSDAC